MQLLWRKQVFGYFKNRSHGSQLLSFTDLTGPLCPIRWQRKLIFDDTFLGAQSALFCPVSCTCSVSQKWDKGSMSCCNVVSFILLISSSLQCCVYHCIYLSRYLKKKTLLGEWNSRRSLQSSLSVNSASWLLLFPLFRVFALKETDLEINPWWCHTGHWHLSLVWTATTH